MPEIAAGAAVGLGHGEAKQPSVACLAPDGALDDPRLSPFRHPGFGRMTVEEPGDRIEKMTMLSCFRKSALAIVSAGMVSSIRVTSADSIGEIKTQLQYRSCRIQKHIVRRRITDRKLRRQPRRRRYPRPSGRIRWSRKSCT